MFDDLQYAVPESIEPVSGGSTAPLAKKATVERVSEARLPTELGGFRIIGYRSLISSEEFVVLARGSLRPEIPTLVRIHSQCLTGDVFGSTKCDCGFLC